MYIKNVDELFDWLNYDYDPSEWLLVTKYNQSKKEVRCTLTDRLNEYESLPFLVSRKEIDEQFETLKQTLEKADYRKHRWELKGDFSAVSDAR